MNILHTAHSKAHGAKQGEGKTSLLNSVGKSANLNSKSKSILELKQDPKYKEINFDNVLAAARKGHDPEAMANLLVKEKTERTAAKETEPMLPFQKPKQTKSLNEGKVSTQEKATELNQTTKKSVPLNELIAQNQPKQKKSILAPMREREAASMARNGQPQQSPKLQTVQQVRMAQPQVAGQTQVATQPQFTGQQQVSTQAPVTVQPQVLNSMQQPQPKMAAKAQYQNASQVAAGTAKARGSIFATPRVLDIQSKSKFASENRMVTSNLNQQRPMANMQLAQVQGTPVQMPQQQMMQRNNSSVVELNQMRAKRSINRPAYKNTQNRMIKAQPERMTQVKPQMMKSNLNTEETSFNKEASNMDMGDQTQRFATAAPMTMATSGQEATTQTAKVLNMNTVQLSGNTDAVINQIQDYVVQTQAANQSEVSVSFEHQDLGQVDLLVQKLDPKGEQLSIQIATRGNEAADFFKTHQGELINTLNRSGLQIADLKLDSASSSSQQEFAQDSSSKEQMFGKGQKQHQSESGQRESDQNRRQELWDQFYENKDAA